MEEGTRRVRRVPFAWYWGMAAIDAMLLMKAE